jgi:hypothetical protein
MPGIIHDGPGMGRQEMRLKSQNIFLTIEVYAGDSGQLSWCTAHYGLDSPGIGVRFPRQQIFFSFYLTQRPIKFSVQWLPEAFPIESVGVKTARE